MHLFSFVVGWISIIIVYSFTLGVTCVFVVHLDLVLYSYEVYPCVSD